MRFAARISARDRSQELNMSSAFVSAASSAPVNVSRSSDGNALMRFGFVVALVFMMPSFIMQLAFDPVNFQFVGSRILQITNLSCTLYGVALILTSRQSRHIVLQCRPALLLVIFAFSSILWSLDPSSTFRGGYILLSTTLFGLALASRLSPTACVKTLLQALALTCVLSVIWVVLFPDLAVHQAGDRIQFQHAGLWRGITSHKQGLGVIAGLTTGFLLFYGSAAFPSFIVRLAAFAAGVACLVGSGSVTGLMTTMILSAMLYITYWIAVSPRQARKGVLGVMGGTIAVLYAAFHFGALDFVMPLFGKSADLTGRTDQWPWVIDNISGSAPLLGGGFASGWEDLWAPAISIDNGYIEVFGSFGYIGMVILFLVYGWALFGGVKMIRSASRPTAHIEILPFNIMFIELFLNVTEASFLTKSINTILICVAICHIICRNNKTAQMVDPRRPRRQQAGG
jgi:exopolysaccharide production protein ExoQ